MVNNIDVHQLKDWLKIEGKLILLDIREAEELSIARFPDSRVIHIPLSLIAEQGLQSIPASIVNHQSKLVVFCHLGIRSAQFCHWFQQFSNLPIYNLLGGINAFTTVYAPDIPQY